MGAMAVAPKKLSIGDLVEIDGRRYEVVRGEDGGISLEPAVSPTSAELHERYGTRPATAEEFDRLFGHLPADGEG